MNLESLLSRLSKLSPETKASWGSLTAQAMIEHLTQGLEMSMGLRSYPMEVSEEKAEKLKAFLYTDQAFTKNIRVGFVTTNAPLNHEDLDLAIDAFCAAFLPLKNINCQKQRKKNLYQFIPILEHLPKMNGVYCIKSTLNITLRSLDFDFLTNKQELTIGYG